MDAKLKEALIDVGVALIKGLKVTFIYIVPAIIVAVLTSSEFRELIEDTPALVAYVPIINVAVVVIADFFKQRSPMGSDLRKIF